MIKIDFDPSSAKQYASKKYGIVVVDVLRATSTIIVAIARGARQVTPCVEVDEARAYRDQFGGILVGERHADIIPGFDFTNSPYDLAKENLKGKNIIITTSTGTRLISECRGASVILIGSTMNASAVARKMLTFGKSWVVIGAGSHGEFRPEDQVGCALISAKYIKLSDDKPDTQTKTFIDTFTEHMETHMQTSPSTQKLIKIGRTCDVDFILQNIDTYSVTPLVTFPQTKPFVPIIVSN
jgi:2-phosphosulfolactate phosphatase